jgi:hypothetical protein
MRPKQARRRLRSLETLEQRLALTVGVELNNGLLSITGDADGPVAVLVGTQTFGTETALGVTVVDNGAPIGTPVRLTELTSGVQVKLNGTGVGADDQVTIDLGDQTLRHLNVDLGEGTNRLTIANGTISRSVSVRGGSGADTVTVAADAVLDSTLMLSLGSGANSINIAGDVGTVLARTNEGLDQLAIVAGAIVDHLFAKLGNGENASIIEGIVARVANVDGGNGDDNLTITGTVNNLVALLGSGNNDVTITGDVTKTAAITTRSNGTDNVTVTGDVGGSLLVNLANGTNTLNVGGLVGGAIGYLGTQGNDTVALASTGTVNGNVVLELGGGDNVVTSAALIAKNLLVLSTNPNDADNITVTEGTVAGDTTIRTSRPRFRDLFRVIIRFFH